MSPYIMPGIMHLHESIINESQKYFKVDLMKETNQQKITYARQVCYYILKLFRYKDAEIAVFFSKERSTVSYGVCRIRDLLDVKDQETVTAVRELKNKAKIISLLTT